MSTVPPPRAPLTRVFIGLWDGMNFIRRLTLNLLFFGLLLLIALVVLVAVALTALSGWLDRRDAARAAGGPAAPGQAAAATPVAC